MCRIRTLWSDYWPVLTLPLIAALLDVVLALDGQALDLSGWITNVVLGGVTPIAVGILLARRQTMIQEALADLELTEKVAVLSYAVADLRQDLHPGSTCRALLDARAGITLLPLAREPMQHEYLRAVDEVLETVEHQLRTSLAPLAEWVDTDWTRFHRVIDVLRERTRASARRSTITRRAWTLSIDPTTEALMTFPREHVPFDVFRAHFTAGPDRIRVQLDWEKLAQLCGRADGAAVISLVRTDVRPYGSAALRRFHAPWYTADGREVGHGHPGATPIAHVDLSAGLSVLAAERRNRIREIQKWYTGPTANRVSLVLATIAVPDGRILVLDGNHRLAALVRLVSEGCPMVVNEFRITTTPFAQDLVPDLAHYQPALTARNGSSGAPPRGHR